MFDFGILAARYENHQWVVVFRGGVTWFGPFD